MGPIDGDIVGLEVVPIDGIDDGLEVGEAVGDATAPQLTLHAFGQLLSNSSNSD